MVTPVAKRQAVAHLCSSFEVSQRRACEVIRADRSSVRYVSLRPDDAAIRSRLRELASVRRRECIALIADTSLSGARVGRELDAVIDRRGPPAMIVSDNGTGLTSMAILRWSQLTRIEWHYIAPGKPQQNAFVESFNAT